ncbi:MAG: 3'-5' exonuclease, partial [Vicinamibacteria bacterium]
VHKAKGLEFPIVFVADLRREEKKFLVRHRERVRARWWRADTPPAREGPGGSAASCDGAVAIAFQSAGKEIFSGGEALRCLDEPRHEAAEEARKFYVACTRAKERLVLVQSDPKGKGSWVGFLEAWGYSCGKGGYPRAESLCGGVVEHRIVEAAPRSGSRSVRDDAKVIDAFARAVERFDAARGSAEESDRPWVTSPTSLHERERLGDLHEEETALEGGVRPDVAMAAGSVIHALLEVWERTDVRWLRENAERFARREARIRSLTESEVVAETGAILESFLESTLPARLREVDIIGREVPVYHPEGGTLVQGIADLLYRASDGAVVVADHKTDSAPRGGAKEIVDRYKPQIAAYVRALRSSLGTDRSIRAELWLIRLGEVVPVAID